MNFMTQRAVLGLLVISIISVVGYVFWQMAQASDTAVKEVDQIICAKDARQCPDGSYVARVPPNCQFEVCSSKTNPKAPKSALIETRINQGASALNVKVTPIELMEDSRCPADVQCIQAGTVRVKAILSSGLGSGPQVFTLNGPITTESEIVTLIEVRPIGKNAGEAILTSNYIFVFKIEKRTDL